MHPDVAVFDALRGRLGGIAYRMLGSKAEAEDVVQDAYLRWHNRDDATALRTPEAWLVTVVTRLSIDRLRALKVQREAYPGPWLPEPIVESQQRSPEAAAEFADDVSIALLTVLEQLAPEERAAFLMHEAFDVDYPDIARTLGRNEAACRQMVRRSKQRVRADRPRFEVSDEALHALLERFVAAARTGKHGDLLKLFADDATLTADGGGKVLSTRRVLHSADRIARFFSAVARQWDDRAQYRFAHVNGELGLLRHIDGKLDCAIAFVTDGQRILHLFVVRNPDKLQGLPR
jgi:RNA polymerase sigma-70 factor (ECF subfamily)